ncbi:HAD-IB family hydrolase [Luteimonas aestuarii]|uniref:HAD-IB family hydrolase n=1 Tax=Luteimonas aestuarii TaxID=453837 RepID=A0A4R5U414_9GAMM|nr:HAD-IB family hydrolase [Luteimonas aestuarii]TDK28470.1 HAD-IB family hydrolase [Luteimonas aestuarii]
MQLALFDFDHTVTTCDTYARFLRRVATPAQLASAKWTVGPWLLGYRLKLVSAGRIRRRVTARVFPGRTPDEIEAHGRAYAREALPALVRPEVMARIGWHRQQGHDVVLVSASLDAYLRPWCAQHGLALLCNTLEVRGGRLTGRYAVRDIGAHKADEIRRHHDLSRYERIHAYGDSGEDRPMLALAHERWYRGVQVA